MNIYSKILNELHIFLVGPDIIRYNLFNNDTKVYLIDPTIFAASGFYSAPAVAASQIVFNTDFVQTAANVVHSQWVSSGWDTTNATIFLAQLKTWADNNLPVTVPGYNAVVGIIPIEQPATYTYENSGLVNFTYNNVLGEVTYNSPVDLSLVNAGNKFRDGIGTYYNVIAFDDLNNKVTIRDISNAIPASISTLVTTVFDGSVFSIIIGTITDYDIAFFYPGNQGPLLP